MIDTSAMGLGLLTALAISMEIRTVDSGELSIGNLAVSFDVITADAEIGEAGTLSGTEIQIGTSAPTARYTNGHLIIDVEVE